MLLHVRGDFKCAVGETVYMEDTFIGRLSKGCKSNRTETPKARQTDREAERDRSSVWMQTQLLQRCYKGDWPRRVTRKLTLCLVLAISSQGGDAAARSETLPSDTGNETPDQLCPV